MKWKDYIRREKAWMILNGIFSMCGVLIMTIALFISNTQMSLIGLSLIYMNYEGMKETEREADRRRRK